jgi:Zn-finger nucleic acid-binding protein
MQCPKCHAPLCAIDCQGVEIQTCPDCGGDWLDAGELAHIAEVQRCGMYGGGAGGQDYRREAGGA